MASASTSSPSLSGQLMLQVPSPRMGRLGDSGTRQRSPLTVAVRGPAPRDHQLPAQGSGGGGKVHATPRAVLMAVGGSTPAQGNGGGGGKVHATPRPVIMVVGGKPPAEGTSGSGGKVHATPGWALMAVGGTVQLDQLPAEGTGGGGGKIHNVPAAAPAANA
ncbi:unnamed protein product [Urochloa humidicola]